MTFKEKLKNLKREHEQSDIKFPLKNLLKSVDELQHTISDIWLNEYKKEGLLKFKFVYVKRQNHRIGKYKTSNLEIYLINNKNIVFTPVFSNSSLNFRLECYLENNPIDKIIIISKHLNENEFEWVFYRSLIPDIFYSFTKKELEKIIESWLLK